MSTDTSAKPTVKFDTPFAVKKTADSVVTAGTGDALATGQTITFDYVLVDGRTGKELADLVRRDAGVAGARHDEDRQAARHRPHRRRRSGAACSSRSRRRTGWPSGCKPRRVKKNDTLLFVIDVKSVRTPLATRHR